MSIRKEPVDATLWTCDTVERRGKAVQAWFNLTVFGAH